MTCRSRRAGFHGPANRIDGVVITFADVTVSKTLEIELRKMQAELEWRVTDKTTELDKAPKDLREKSDQRDRPGKRV